MTYLFVALAIIFRFAMLAISMKNEKALKENGATEYGRLNTKALTIAHILFYCAAVWEYYRADTPRSLQITAVGVILYLGGIAALLWVVSALGRLWTIKLIIARDHVVIRSGPYKWFRHPNYYLNILPELLGFALALNASWTLAIGAPIYAIPLILRIREENRLMSDPTRFR